MTMNRQVRHAEGFLKVINCYNQESHPEVSIINEGAPFFFTLLYRLLRYDEKFGPTLPMDKTLKNYECWVDAFKSIHNKNGRTRTISADGFRNLFNFSLHKTKERENFPLETIVLILGGRMKVLEKIQREKGTQYLENKEIRFCVKGKINGYFFYNYKSDANLKICGDVDSLIDSEFSNGLGENRIQHSNFFYGLILAIAVAIFIFQTYLFYLEMKKDGFSAFPEIEGDGSHNSNIYERVEMDKISESSRYLSNSFNKKNLHPVALPHNQNYQAGSSETSLEFDPSKFKRECNSSSDINLNLD